MTKAGFIQKRPERRNEQRICDPFPARVKGKDLSGRDFEVETVIDNISTGHLYLRLLQEVGEGDKLSVVFRLWTAADKWEVSPRVEVKGQVMRTEPRPGGVCGVAIAYKLHRFHFAQA